MRSPQVHTTYLCQAAFLRYPLTLSNFSSKHFCWDIDQSFWKEWNDAPKSFLQGEHDFLVFHLQNCAASFFKVALSASIILMKSWNSERSLEWRLSSWAKKENPFRDVVSGCHQKKKTWQTHNRNLMESGWSVHSNKWSLFLDRSFLLKGAFR